VKEPNCTLCGDPRCQCNDVCNSFSSAQGYFGLCKGCTDELSIRIGEKKVDDRGEHTRTTNVGRSITKLRAMVDYLCELTGKESPYA
jgi:hypothetical protein